MIFEWDRSKSHTNFLKHGLEFDIVREFAWHEAMIIKDDRKDYGEDRYIAYGPIEAKFCAIVFTIRGKHVRIIGLRKAYLRERKLYDQKT